MSNPSAAELALREGDVTRALKLLTEQVRAKPQDITINETNRGVFARTNARSAFSDGIQHRLNIRR